MTQAQRTQRIYALGARLGILESGNKDDLLHNIVFRLTGKKRIRDLNESEYKAVVNDLCTQLIIDELDEPPRRRRKYESVPGMMSEGQQKMVWKLMYQLKDYDISASSTTLGNRLCCIIKKELHVDCPSGQPLRWLTYAQGSKLIEIIKKYVSSAQRRKESATGTDN